VIIAGENRTTLELTPGQILRIPAGAIRAYLSRADDTIFNITRTNANLGDKEFGLEELGIEWPEDGLRKASIAPLRAPEDGPDFAIVGSGGRIGAAFVKYFEREGIKWYGVKAGIGQQEAIRNEIGMVRPSVGVIVATGGVGEGADLVDVLDVNVTGQLALAGICESLKVHCTLIGVGRLYEYDAGHVPGGVAFVETDPPNSVGTFEGAMRAELERLLEQTGAISGVLNLRAVDPVDGNVDEILRLSQVSTVPTSFTVLPALVPLAVALIKEKQVGHVNWVCRGVTTYGEILRQYQQQVDPTITISGEAPAETTQGAALAPARLIARFGEENVPEVHAAIAQAFGSVTGQP
jgi:hypothetical protein